MKQIMIMSHSIFAEGIKSACEDMLGPQNDIITIGFTNNAEFEKTISDKLDKIPEEDELILLFDSMRGTPCTAVIELLRKKNISKKSLLLTGINLPVLEQVIRYKEEMSLEELKDKVMQLAVSLLREQLYLSRRMEFHENLSLELSFSVPFCSKVG